MTFKEWKASVLKNSFVEHLDKIEFSVTILCSFDKSEEEYNAHVLEYDIVGEGQTKNEAIDNALNSVYNHITFCLDFGNKDKIVNPAPNEYWKIFFHGFVNNEVKIESSNSLKNYSKNIPPLPYRTSSINNLQVVCG